MVDSRILAFDWKRKAGLNRGNESTADENKNERMEGHQCIYPHLVTQPPVLHPLAPTYQGPFPSTSLGLRCG